MSKLASGLGQTMPIYVTRKDAHGQTMTYSQTYWMTALAQFVVWFNVVLWAVVGVVEAVRVIF